MTPEERTEYLARQKARTRVIGLALASLAVLFYVLTFVRM